MAPQAFVRALSRMPWQQPTEHRPTRGDEVVHAVGERLRRGSQAGRRAATGHQPQQRRHSLPCGIDPALDGDEMP